MSDTPSDRRPWWEGDYVYRPAEQPDSPPEPRLDRHEEPIRLPDLVPCWRCGKGWEAGARFCPFCRARLSVASDTPSRSGPARPAASASSLLTVMLFFGIMLLVSVIYFVVLVTSNNPSEEGVIRGMAIVEVIDTFLALGAFLAVREIKASPSFTPRQRAMAWLAGPPVLAALLGLNFAYTEMLRRAFPLLAVDPDLPLTWWMVLLVCVQPAVVEEFFFRYLLMGALRSHVGLHGAVLLSSVMFGVAHLGQPLGIPVLILIGVGLGYMRHASGGLLLPVLMHFTHNLVVLLVQT